MKELLNLRSKVEALTNKGQTPLHLAVYSGSYDCVDLLVKRKADVNAATSEERKTPLHMACESGFAHIAQLLIQSGADVHRRNLLERTPLHCVGISDRTDLALLLLRAGAKYDALDAHGWTARQVAELHGHVAFQELMARQGMAEKQAVFREMPRAPWHSDLWTGVVAMQAQRRDEHHREEQRAQQQEAQLSQMRLERQQAARQARREERQAELRLYNSLKASSILQEARAATSRVTKYPQIADGDEG